MNMTNNIGEKRFISCELSMWTMVEQNEKIYMNTQHVFVTSLFDWLHFILINWLLFLFFSYLWKSTLKKMVWLPNQRVFRGQKKISWTKKMVSYIVQNLKRFRKLKRILNLFRFRRETYEAFKKSILDCRQPFWRWLGFLRNLF